MRTASSFRRTGRISKAASANGRCRNSWCPVDLDLKIDSIGLGQEDLSNAIARLSLDRGQARLDRFEFTAPGETRSPWRARLGLDARGRHRTARWRCNPSTSDRFARYLDRLNLRSPFLTCPRRTAVRGLVRRRVRRIPVVSFNRLR